MDKLIVHEELREAGKLVTRDALNKLKTKEQLIFYSHQWTSPTEPDPYPERQLERRMSRSDRYQCATHTLGALVGTGLAGSSR